MDKISWNPVLNKVIQIKREWEAMHSDEFGHPIRTFEEMLEDLNKEEYNELFGCLQFNQFNEFLLIRYGLEDMQKGLWEDPKSIYRECRSVVIDLDKECLVLTPYRKFFNVNEVEENSMENVVNMINKARVVEWANKLDGSMQSARWYNNKVFMSGSMALDPRESWRLEEGYNMITPNHKKMLRESEEVTFIFEFIHPRDIHVVNYRPEEKGLYLIGMRSTATGATFSYSAVECMAKIYGVPCTRVEDKTIDEVMAEMKTLKSSDKEGWVLNVDGHRVKFKCDDYVNLHRIIDKVSSINAIIENVVENRVDDMMSKLPDGYKERVGKMADVIIDWGVETKSVVEYLTASLYTVLGEDCDRKQAMLWIDANVEKRYRGYVKNEFLGKEYNVYKKRGGYNKKVADMHGVKEKLIEVMCNE